MTKMNGINLMNNDSLKNTNRTQVKLVDFSKITNDQNIRKTENIIKLYE